MVLQLSLATGVVQDRSGNVNNASSSTDNSVTYDQLSPGAFSVNVDIASGIDNPTVSRTGVIDIGGAGIDHYEISFDG